MKAILQGQTTDISGKADLSYVNQQLALKANQAEVDTKNQSQDSEINNVKTIANNALPKSGGTMTGQIAMSNQKITELGTCTEDNDAANKAYVDAQVAANSGSSESTFQKLLTGRLI